MFRKLFFLFSFYSLLVPAISCTGAGPAAVSNPDNNAPSDINSNSSTTTVASAAPTAQPTEPFVPTTGVWIRLKTFLPGSDTNSDCETGFHSIPTVEVWFKNAQQDHFEKAYTVGKAQSGVDDPDVIKSQMCGHFTVSGFWIPLKDECFNGKSSVFYKVSYAESGKTYTGQSNTYSCPEEIPDQKIILSNNSENLYLKAPPNPDIFSN